MPDITKHDTEEEGKCHDSEESRVDFLVARNTIRVDDFLEDIGEIIPFKESGRLAWI